MDSTPSTGRDAAAVSNQLSSVTANQRLILAIIGHGVSECQNVRVIWEKLAAPKDGASGEAFQLAVAELLSRGLIIMRPDGRLELSEGGRQRGIPPPRE